MALIEQYFGRGAGYDSSGERPTRSFYGSGMTVDEVRADGTLPIVGDAHPVYDLAVVSGVNVRPVPGGALAVVSYGNPNFLREPSVNDLDVNYSSLSVTYETVDVDVPLSSCEQNRRARATPTPSSKHGRSLISESRFVFPAPFSGSRRPCNGRSRKRWIRFSPYRARCRPRRASCTSSAKVLSVPARNDRAGNKAAGEWCTSGSMIRGLRTPYRMSASPDPTGSSTSRERTRSTTPIPIRFRRGTLWISNTTNPDPTQTPYVGFSPVAIQDDNGYLSLPGIAP